MALVFTAEEALVIVEMVAKRDGDSVIRTNCRGILGINPGDEDIYWEHLPSLLDITHGAYCPECKEGFLSFQSMRGERFQCPLCGHWVTVPS